jgi:hypothetical protein
MAVMLMGDRQGHQLLQRDFALLVVRQQTRRNVGEAQPPLDHQRRDAEVGGNVLDRPALCHQRLPGEQFIDRGHGLALHVLREAHGPGRGLGHQQAGHRMVLAELAALGQQLERGQSPAPGHHLEMLAIG